MNQSERVEIKRYDLFASRLIVCLLMCVEDAANEALLARGNPIDRSLSPDNADQFYCIDCISPSLAPMRGVCVCGVLGKHTEVAVQVCAMSLLCYVGW